MHHAYIKPLLLWGFEISLPISLGTNVQIKLCVCVCECACVCLCLFICCICTHTHKYNMHPCILKEETNVITAASHILSHYDESCYNLTSTTNSCHANICPSPIYRLSHTISLSKLSMLCAQPLVACVGTYSVVWWWFNSFICGRWDLGMQAT